MEEILRYIRAINHVSFIIDFFCSAHYKMAADPLFDLVRIIYNTEEANLQVPWEEVKDIGREMYDSRMIMLSNFRAYN